MKGMKAEEQIQEIEEAKKIWDEGREAAIGIARKLQEFEVHKQITNRVLEPFSTIKTVVTSTDYWNFFKLRCHPDAQPEIQELAYKMRELYLTNKPKQLNYEEWHLPYYYDGFWTRNSPDRLENAIIISVSCCAQVSYRKLDTSLENAKRIFDKLVKNDPPHASPLEHQAKPIDDSIEWEIGVTHIDKFGEKWSGNLKGWNQYRQIYFENHS